LTQINTEKKLLRVRRFKRLFSHEFHEWTRIKKTFLGLKDLKTLEPQITQISTDYFYNFLKYKELKISERSLPRFNRGSIRGYKDD